MTPKERIYAILGDKPYDRVAVTPIFMAWSANYAGHTYKDYYLDSDVLVKSQLAVVRDFSLDQISAISDPFREASAYGMEFDYPEDGVGKPRELLIKKPEDIAKIGHIDIENSPRIRDRIEGVAGLTAEVGDTHSVLGWVEGPIAEYADLRGVENTMMDLFDKPEMFVEAAEIIVQNAVEFARAQIRAGADMIGVGDAAASLIGPDMYEKHILSLEKKLIDGIHEAGGTVKLHICGNVSSIVSLMAQTGADILDIDWMVDLKKARIDAGDDVTLCGNFDPAGILLQGTPEIVADASRKCIEQAGKKFILQPGCEVPPKTPDTNIRAFCPCRGTHLGDIFGDIT